MICTQAIEKRMADMRATKEWAELEKILAEFERLELGSEAMGLATNFANQVGWLGPGPMPCHRMACPVRRVIVWRVGCPLRRGTVPARFLLCAACWPPTRIANGVGALNARSC